MSDRFKWIKVEMPAGSILRLPREPSERDRSTIVMVQPLDGKAFLGYEATVTPTTGMSVNTAEMAVHQLPPDMYIYMTVSSNTNIRFKEDY